MGDSVVLTTAPCLPLYRCWIHAGWLKSGVAMHICNSSIWKAKTGRSQVWGLARHTPYPSLKNKMLKPGRVAPAFNPSTWEAEVSLFYRMSSRAARTRHKNIKSNHAALSGKLELRVALFKGTKGRKICSVFQGSIKASFRQLSNDRWLNATINTTFHGDSHDLCLTPACS